MTRFENATPRPWDQNWIKKNSTTERAWFAEHDGLSFKSASKLAHPTDLTKWENQNWIKNDLDADCFRLTAEGRQHSKETCATCNCWKFLSENRGECWSMDRLDDDASNGPASITAEYETCEAWISKRAEP